MSDAIATTDHDTTLIDSAIELLKADNFTELSELLASQEPAEIAHLLESLPDIRRSSIWSQVPDEFKGEVLSHMGEVALLSLVDSIDHEEVVNAAADMDTSELAGVIEAMPDDIGESIRESLDYRGLRELDAALAFPEDTAGRLMNTEAVSIRADVDLETVLRYLRFRESLPDHTAGLMVVDREGHFLG
jgi:magnesium transporter